MSRPAVGQAWERLSDALLVHAARSGAGDARPSRAELGRLRSAFRKSLREPLPFSILVDAAALDDEAAEVLALLCSVELDWQREVLVGSIDGENARRRPTLRTLAGIFGPDHAGPRAVGVSGRLRRAELVEVADSGPWAARIVTAHPTVVWSLMGDGGRDPDLPPDATVLTAPEPDADGADFVVVSGEDRTRRLQAAVRDTGGTSFLVTPAPPDTTGWSAVIREATLGRLGVVVEVDDDLSADGRRAIERADHLAWAVSSPHELPVDSLPRRPWVARLAGREPPSDDEWAAALGADVPRRHPLTADQLRRVAVACPAVGGDIDAAVRRLAAGRIDRLARRIVPRQSWEDLVLPDDHLAQLGQLAARYRNRDTVYGEWGFRASPSGGVTALFAGPSGTGKTMAAEVLAGELGLELYKLDVAAVVSKYIGETEKNLERVFDAAAAGNVVLFFDEADALFGKRTEVSDAHDRYANVEVAYLLQRLEAYEGVVILATNLQKNIDTAFLRRLHAVIDFPVPDEAERRRIWQRNLRDPAPLRGVDIDALAARFVITGGVIRNAALAAAFLAALAAAFLAAEAGTPITMDTVLAAVGLEYQKIGRLVDPADFRVAPVR